jgi:hypothetical protein
MPISYGNVEMQAKLLPLILNDNGSATVTARMGYTDSSNVFTPISQQTFTIESSDVSQILDVSPVAGLTRRDDLSLAVYNYLVSKGLMSQGTIS